MARTASTLLVVVFAACGDEVAAPLTRLEDCPQVVEAEGSYPNVSYVTFVVNGETVAANEPYLQFGSHSGRWLNEDPAFMRDLRPEQVESISVHKGAEAEALGACPGVGVVVVTTRR